MKKQKLDLEGIGPEVIDEYLFDLIADRLNAEQQIVRNQKLLEEALEFEDEHQKKLQKADEPDAIANLEEALQHNSEMKALLVDRNEELKSAISTFDAVIARLRS